MGRLTNDDLQFIKDNVDKMTNQEMANKIGCNKHTISTWRKKLGISFTDLHDFSEYDDYIIKNYYKKTAKKLAEEIGCSKQYICKIWRLNCEKNKTRFTYYADYHYFNNIDTATKAYILGWICSDGCVYKREGHIGMWQIVIHKDDKQILEDIKKEIKAEHPIKIDKTACLSINSDEMYNDLVGLGIIPNKTYTMNLQQVIDNIPTIYHKDFLHGYFDGDGSITVGDKPSQSRLQFAIPQRFQQPLQQLINNLGLESHFTTDGRTYKYTIPFGNLTIQGATNKYCLCQLFIYENTISLQRKTDKLKTLSFQIKNNITNRNENIIAVKKCEELLGSLRR